MEPRLPFFAMYESALKIGESKIKTYGVQINGKNGGERFVIEDISTIREIVQSIIDKLNRGDVSLLHVMDIVEDELP